MYQLKSTPEDFIVREIPNIELNESGKYIICLLKKTNYSNIRALEQISHSLNIPLKNIGFAGTKDKNAITYQFISIKGSSIEKLENIRLKDIELSFIGYSDNPISLGLLEGNEFIITIRNLSEKDIKIIENKTSSVQFMPNLFGEQRFSINNKEIGKHLLKQEFKEAIDLILDSNSDYKENITSFLKENTNNFTAALHLIPKKLLKLYLHSYQSYLWNKSLMEYIKLSKQNTQLPIIGFGTEIEDKKIEKIITKIMHEEQITERDFINRKIPELSSEGDLRDAFTEIKELKILEKKESEIKINFKLNKGSYATIAVSFLLDCLDSVINNLI